jgi:hypothetical protein
MAVYRYDYTWLVRMRRNSSQPDVLAELVSEFGHEVSRKLREQAGQPEAQLRDPFARLLQGAGDAMGLDVLTIDETPLNVLGVRPDFMVIVAGARVGFAELKKQGRKVPGTWSAPTKHEREQWEQLRLLPNVLYSDGEQWAVYHYGELEGSIARLDGDLRTAGSKLRPADGAFAQVIEEFLQGKPEPPRTIGQLVRAVSRLCRLLRDEVAQTLHRENTGAEPEPVFTALANDWREYLFPDLLDADFADAYAQTVTFGLLLARASGISFEGAGLPEIARLLGKRHSLMGKALDVLTERVAGRSIAVTTLQRIVGAIDWDELSRDGTDTYLQLYQDFLEQYDAGQRQRSGSYYTPNAVVASMVRFTEEILRTRMGIGWGLAAPQVTIADPAMGTGTFLLNIISSVARTVEEEEGREAVPPQLRALLGRLIGFERQAGPFAVAELRIHQALKTLHATEAAERDARLLLTDTLDDPYADEPHVPATLEPIGRSRREANKIKREMPVLVVIGNPPYREKARGQGGWIERGSPGGGHPPPLQAFRAAGHGKYENVLSNLYVYFWRWATWKVFDAHEDHPTGLVAFISPSSFTTGAGYAGMREYLRRTADEGWIIDLSPEKFRPEEKTRVFRGVQHKLCIAVFARYGREDPGVPARIRYVAVTGSRKDKFRRLAALGINDPGWSDCGQQAHDLLNPAAGADWQQFPALGDLMPWSHTGITPNRNWVHAPTRDILQQRWTRLIRAAPDEKAALLKTTRDRDISTVPPPLPGSSRAVTSIASETSTAANTERVALRSFDRQYVIYDARVLDFARRPLWHVRGGRQVYVTEQHAHPIEGGPGLTFASIVPGVDHFNGRGGRVLPLYRDPSGQTPNIAPGLTQAVARGLDTSVTAEDILAYVAGVTSHPAYPARFADDLRTPGVRVPLTADPALWAETARLGRTVIWLHTYGERYADPADGRPQGPPKLAKGRRPQVIATIPDTPDAMPEKMSYDPLTATLHVGDGAIRPVSRRVWEYEVSGMKVIPRWFDYRKKNPRVRWSSPLSDIFSIRWPPEFTTDLLELLNVLFWCADLESMQADILGRICSGPLITVDDLHSTGVLPPPSSSRKPPVPEDPDALTLF